MKKTQYGKSLIVFAGWAFVGLSALLMANAYTIQTNIDNAVAYLKKMVFMDNTWNTTWVIIDGNASGTDAKLFVNGNIVLNGNISNMTSDSGTLTLFDGNTGVRNRIKLGADSSGAYIIGTYGLAGWTKNLIINKDGGHVGIGTTSTAWTLHVKGGSSNVIIIESTSQESDINFINSWSVQNRQVWVNNNINWFFVYNGNYRFVVNNSGDVGIGTTTPTTKIDVVWQIKISNEWDTSITTCINAWAIKYYNTHFYWCDGTNWEQLDN